MGYRRETFNNGHFYHVIFRGFNKKNLFLQKRDYLRFLISAFAIKKIPSGTDLNLSRLGNRQILDILNGNKDFSPELIRKPTPPVKISTFNLLRNHSHFLLKQLKTGGIQEFAHRLQTSYGKFFNIKYKKRGPVFEKNFRSVTITDDRQFRYVVGYITLNTLDTAGIGWRRSTLRGPWVKIKNVLESYPWSSYHYFMGKKDFAGFIDGDLARELFPEPEKFEKHLKNWKFDDVVHV